MVSSADRMDSNEPTPVQRRNPPGTKAQDFYKWPEQNFDEMESTLAVLQYIQQTIRKDFTATELILTIPSGQDEGVWKYEHLRQFCMELNGLAVKLQTECTPKTCSQMTATEQWIFLCAAHKTPRECPAIDYTRHTLDGAACLLNSNKYFPSRVSIKESSVAKLGSVCRRVYRIFSHAYYHHRHIFDEAENETYLCRRFTEFVIKYNLMSQDNLIVPILDESALNNTSNNNSAIENMLPAHFHVSSKPEGSTGISSFLDLPEGVVQDFSDGVEDSSEESTLDVDGGTAADDDFSFTGDFGTLKPMKTSSLDAAEEGEGDAMNSTAIFVASPDSPPSPDEEEQKQEKET